MTPDQIALSDKIQEAGARYASIFGCNSLAEGWDLFNVDDPLRCGIERHDEAARFEGDDEACIFVAEQVLTDSDTTNGRYARALAIHMMANELRSSVWGWQYVNSRMGP